MRMHDFHDGANSTFSPFVLCPPVNTASASSSTQIEANSVTAEAESKEDSAEGGADSTTIPRKRKAAPASTDEVFIKLEPGVVPASSVAVTIKSEFGIIAPAESKDDTSAGAIQPIVTRKRRGEVGVSLLCGCGCGLEDVETEECSCKSGCHVLIRSTCKKSHRTCVDARSKRKDRGTPYKTETYRVTLGTFVSDDQAFLRFAEKVSVLNILLLIRH